MSNNALTIASELIKYYEGCRLDTYLDTAGHPTIGWGHLLAPDEQHITTIPQEIANQWLMDDLLSSVNDIANWVDIPINPCQEGALISLVYNIGLTKLMKSRCFYWLNRARFDDCLKEWDFGANKRVNNGRGVFRRREAEKLLFKSDPAKTPDFLTIFNEAKRLGDAKYNLLNGVDHDKSNAGNAHDSRAIS